MSVTRVSPWSSLPHETHETGIPRLRTAVDRPRQRHALLLSPRELDALLAHQGASAPRQRRQVLSDNDERGRGNEETRTDTSPGSRQLAKPPSERRKETDGVDRVVDSRRPGWVFSDRPTRRR